MITQHTAGDITLTKTKGAWVATISNLTKPLVDEDGWLRADLGDGEIRFREASHEAYWLQSGGEVNDQAFATPLALTGNADVWNARVIPLPDELRLSLVVRDDDTAFIREPNHNFGRFVGTLIAKRTGDAITFTDQKGKDWLHATRTGESLHVEFTGTPMKLELRRTTPPVSQPWQPHVPPVGDGWDIGTLAEVGLSPTPIATWIDQIRTTVPTDAHAPAIQALLITRHGKLVVDEYFDGFSVGRPHDVRSAGKSFSSTLAGIFVDRNAFTLDTPLLPDDPQKSKITLAHVLSMSTGLDCDDHDSNNKGGEDVMQQQKQQKNWQQWALDLPVARPPGTKGIYCTPGINLAGFYLARATHEWIPALWTEHLARPLGMQSFYLNLQPDEQGYLGGGAYLRPRDFAKLAQVFLDHGQWHGTPIVSAAWIANATAAHASLNSDSDYGFGWWRTTLAGHTAFYASGNGGQLSIAIPDLDIVVTIMAGNYQDHETWRHFIEDDVPRFVIAAVTGQPSAGGSTKPASPTGAP
ncbi:MAG: serine hydrolase domain-containing protein [Kofleriaceae bacterium]